MSSSVIAVFPGTFDPITLGHIDIIQRAMALVDRLVIGVAINRDKGPMFTLEERVAMVEAECAARLCKADLVTGMVGNVSDIGAQKRLDRWVDSAGAESVKAKVETDRTLGGVVERVDVEGPTDYGVFIDPGGGALLGCTWKARVTP